MATFNTIATAVKAVIDGLSLGITTRIRKEGSLQPRDFDGGGLTFPLVLIWLKADDGESWATLGNGTSDLGTIGRDVILGVDLYRESQGDITSNQDANPDIFQAIKRALNTATLANASTVWNTRLGTNALWEDMAFSIGGEMSHCDLTFCGAEPRNA